jgi:predicted permease
MGIWSRVRSLQRNAMRQTQVDRDLDEELNSYLEMLIEEKIASGMPSLQARREAMVQLGGFTQVQQAVREKRLGMTIDSITRDLKFAARTLLRDWAFSASAMAILAIGIGANVAVFSVVNEIVLRPLPFADSSRLVWMIGGEKLDSTLRASIGLSGETFPVDVFQEVQRRDQAFASVTSFDPFFANSEYTLTGTGKPQAVAGVMVAGNFFQTLGVTPELGRTFSSEELQKGGRPAVLLTESFWRLHCNANPDIVGQTLGLNNKLHTVIGVLPASFDFGAVFAPGMKFDVFVPAVMDDMRNWGNTLSMVGRLKPDVSVAQAQAESDELFLQLQKAHGDWGMDYTPRMVGLKEHVSGGMRRSLIVLWIAVGAVLLIVCVNLSSLLLARASVRTKEFATRIALGAGPGRLLSQLFAEGLLLALAGAASGLCLAFALTAFLARQNSIAVPLLSQVRVDGAAAGWMLILITASTIVFALVPALQLFKQDLQNELKNGGRSMTPGSRAEHLRSLMVVLQVALTCMLLVGAGLLLRSFLNTLREDIGFDPSRASLVKIDYGQQQDAGKRTVILQEILSKVDAIPGIEAAGVTDMLPLGRNRSWQVRAKKEVLRKGQIETALVRVVTPGYIDAMGMRLLAGRDFGWQDNRDRSPVVIVNEAAARHFWHGQNPIGKTAVVDDRDAQVIGVLFNVRENSLEAEAGPEIYVPVMQFDPEGAELVVRSRLPASTFSASVMKALREINPEQPQTELQPLSSIVNHAASPRRFLLVLVMGFAGTALVLATLGIYALIAYSVAQRTTEIGIRMALGASSFQVLRSTMAQVVRLTGAGIGAGAVGSLLIAHGIATLLYGTTALDPWTYAEAIGVLTTAAVLAGSLPAWRASQIDPARVLRQ